MFYSSLTALIIYPFYISFLFFRKTLMARNGLLCADVPLRNYSINQTDGSMLASNEGGMKIIAIFGQFLALSRTHTK